MPLVRMQSMFAGTIQYEFFLPEGEIERKLENSPSKHVKDGVLYYLYSLCFL